LITLRVVDAFTSVPFGGNPAAVALLDSFPTERLMQAIALEMNLSETAFAVRRDDGSYDLRWFTPTTEVDLCGHATLACAHIVGGSARFHTRSGVLDCRRDDNGIIWMDFPADPPAPTPAPASLSEALGGAAIVGSARGRFYLLVELADAGAVRAVRPDLAAISALDCRGVIVTAAGDSPGVDFVSRFFAPSAGIPEDPVTGSAHCTLACHWAPRTGRSELTGYQESPRGGTVRVRLARERVELGGQAVTVSEVRIHTFQL
jgi:predicted PhzF superfamily epimerase YddE/YHI9